MKALVKVNNIGGLRGNYQFEFKTGINILKSSNSSGKTSLIKGITATYCYPIISKEFLTEGEALGIIGKDDQLISLGENKATIEIEIDKIKRKLELLPEKKSKLSLLGDERALFAAYLTRECKTARMISIGDNNCEWIIKYLSYASEYEYVKELILNKKEKLNEKLDLINYKNEEYEENIIKLKELENELINTENKINELELEQKNIFSTIPGISESDNMELQEKSNKKNEIKNKIKKTKNILEEKRKEVEEKKKKISKIERNLENLKNNEAKTKKEINELKNIIKGLSKEKNEIHEVINSELMELDNKIELFNNERENFIEKRGEINGLLYLYESVINLLKNKSEKVKCPICNSNDISKEHLYKEIKKFEEDIKKINDELLEKIAKRDELKQEKEEIIKRSEKISQTLNNKKEALEEKNDEYERIKIDLDRETRSGGDSTIVKREIEGMEEKINEITNELDERKNLLKDLESEINLLIKKTQEIENIKGKKNRELGKLTEKLNNYQKEEKKITREINKIKNEILQNPTENINEIELSLDISKEIYLNWIKYYDSLIEILDEKINDQKKGAMIRFNNSIKKIMKNIGFLGFSDIYLNDLFEIIIERKLSSEIKRQSLSSLSTSEKNILILLLQRAIKEAYLPDLPFFIIDGFIFDFNLKRIKKVLDYLTEISISNKEFIIITIPGDNEDIQIIESNISLFQK